MKTMKKLFLVELIAVAFFTASCVDNVVSPQVEAIRTQQVEWMKAKVAAEAALTAMKTADVAYRNAQAADLISQTAIAAAVAADLRIQTAAINANINLTNDEKLRALAALNAQNELTATILFNQAKADNEVKYAQAQTALALEKVNLANATAALATATANANNASATAYYASYKAAADNVAALTTTKLANTKLIADNNIAITFATTQGANIIEQVGVNKKKAQYDLAAQTANLAVLNAIAVDPASIQTQIDNLKKLDQKYQVSIDSANVVYQNKTLDINAKNTAYTSATATVSTYLGLKGTWQTAQTDSTNKEAAIVTTTKNIATLTTTLAADNTTAATNLGIYTNAKANSDAKQAIYDAYKAASDAANTTLTNANAAFDLATANYTADPSTANLNAKTAATTALTNATTAFNTANASTSTALTNLNAALAITTPAKSDYDNALLTINATIAVNGYDGTQTLLTKAQASLASQQQLLADAKTNIKVTRDKIVALTAAYNIALTSSAALNNTYQAAVDDRQKTTDVINAKTTLLSANTALMSSLNTALTNASTIQTSIVTTQNAIKTAKDLIAGYDSQLASADSTTGKTALVNANVKLALDNAALDIEIANANKLAAYWKDLLDKLFV